MARVFVKHLSGLKPGMKIGAEVHHGSLWALDDAVRA